MVEKKKLYNYSSCEMKPCVGTFKRQGESCLEEAFSKKSVKIDAEKTRTQ